MDIYKLTIEIRGSTELMYFTGFPSREDVLKVLNTYIHTDYIRKEALDVLDKITGWFDNNVKELQELYIKGDTWGGNITLSSFYCHHVVPKNPDESFRNYGDNLFVSTIN